MRRRLKNKNKMEEQEQGESNSSDDIFCMEIPSMDFDSFNMIGCEI